MTNCGKIYGVRNWRHLYENADTRRRKNLGWVLTPNRQDSRAYGRIMARGSDGLKVFGGWMVLLQLASRGPVELRGVLCDSDGNPYSIEDMAIKTRLLIPDLEFTIEVLTNHNWLFVESQTVTNKTQKNTNGIVELPHKIVDLLGGEIDVFPLENKQPTEKNSGNHNPAPESCLKNKKKNKNKNPLSPLPPTNNDAKPLKTGGGILQIPNQLNTEPFLKAWGLWVEHLGERFGGASNYQLAAHLRILNKDNPEAACERLNKSIELGFRAPCKPATQTPSAPRVNELDELKRKIERQIK
jgi:hypothetical protein